MIRWMRIFTSRGMNISPDDFGLIQILEESVQFCDVMGCSHDGWRWGWGLCRNIIRIVDNICWSRKDMLIIGFDWYCFIRRLSRTNRMLIRGFSIHKARHGLWWRWFRVRRWWGWVMKMIMMNSRTDVRWGGWRVTMIFFSLMLMLHGTQIFQRLTSLQDLMIIRFFKSVTINHSYYSSSAPVDDFPIHPFIPYA